MCLTYFFAGTEKLLISHFSWINPITFKAYLALHQAPIGMIVAENTLLCTLLPIGALVFQLTFFIILFYPKMSKWYILGGFCFHWGTTLLFGISWFINPWLMPYLFFIDWEKLYFVFFVLFLLTWIFVLSVFFVIQSNANTTIGLCKWQI